MKRFVMFTAMLMAAVLPMELLAQTADYNKVIAQAKADLAAGHNAEALAGSQKAIEIDPSRWEAYLVAGGALENQKQFDLAVPNYSRALERAPEAKKSGVRDLIEHCKKLSATSNPLVSANPSVATVLQGFVRDSERRPVPGAPVSLDGKEGTLTARTDQTGAYRFYASEVRPGTYSLSVKMNGSFGFANVSPFVLGQNESRAIDIILDPGKSSVQGFVRDSEHRPVPSAPVCLQAAEDGGQLIVHTDSAGAYLFSAVRPGVYSMRVCINMQYGFGTVLPFALGQNESRAIDITLDSVK